MRELGIKSLPKDSDKWVDSDAMILHSCFQILVNYVEDEKVFDILSYEGTQKIFLDEVRALYDWWLIRRETIYHPDSKGFEKDDCEDDVYLDRLIKIRKKLWC
jgi:hypothetical protein